MKEAEEYDCCRVERVKEGYKGKKIKSNVEIDCVKKLWSLNRVKLISLDNCLNPAHIPYWWVNNPTMGAILLCNDRKSQH